MTTPLTRKQALTTAIGPVVGAAALGSLVGSRSPASAAPAADALVGIGVIRHADDEVLSVRVTRGVQTNGLMHITRSKLDSDELVFGVDIGERVVVELRPDHSPRAVGYAYDALEGPVELQTPTQLVISGDSATVDSKSVIRRVDRRGVATFVKLRSTRIPIGTSVGALAILNADSGSRRVGVVYITAEHAE